MQRIGFYAVIGGFVFGVGYISLYAFSWLAVTFLGLLLVLFALGYAFVRCPAYLVVLAVLLATCAGGVRAMSVPTGLPPSFAPLIERRVELEGTIVVQPDARETAIRLTVEVEREGERTRVIASAPPRGEYRVGDYVLVSGTFVRPEPFATDGGRTFAYDTFLAKDGVFALVQRAQVEVIGRDRRPVLLVPRALQVVRDGFIDALGRALPEPESALAAGLIAGGKQGLGKELVDVFTVAGLIHIVVLSGYNVMIVAEAVLRACGFLPKRFALSLAALTIALFVLAAGAGAAALRAGAMALLGLLARFTGRTYAVLRALFAVLALMLLWNPLLLMHDPGFQFSFVATLGLILLAPHIERFFSFVRSGLMRDIAAATFAAQFGVLPLLLFHTGNLSLVSFGVNLVVLPVIPLAMGLSAAAAGLALLLPAAAEVFVTAAALPAYGMLAYVIGSASFAADLPFANVIIPIFPFWVVVLAYAFLAFLVWKLKGTTAGAVVPTGIPAAL